MRTDAVSVGFNVATTLRLAVADTTASGAIVVWALDTCASLTAVPAALGTAWTVIVAAVPAGSGSSSQVIGRCRAQVPLAVLTDTNRIFEAGVSLTARPVAVAGPEFVTVSV